MAHIDYHKGNFYGLGTWEEREIWKRAGFKWSGVRKAWITDRQDVAEAVDGVMWTDRAREHVDLRLKQALASVGLSYAAESGFRVPMPGRIHPRTGLPFDFLPFQHVGVEYALQRKDTLIGDPPGLGKTLQAVGVSNCDIHARRILVICPASLKENWRREWTLWDTKGLTVGIAETSKQIRVPDGIFKSGKRKGQPKTRIAEVIPEFWPDTEVVIVNPDILSRYEKQIKGQVWDILIVDEAHSLKTAESGRTLFVLGGSRKEFVLNSDGKKTNRKERVYYNPIEANRRVFLTGTPMMNRPVELWPIVKAFDPNGLGRNYEEYVYRYCGAWHDPMRGKFGALDVSGATNLEELGQKLRAAFMIRRSKKEVLPELPDIFRQVVLLDSLEIRDLVERESEIAEALKLYEVSILKNNRSELEQDIEIGKQVIDVVEKYGFGDAYADPDKPNARALNIEFAAAILGLEPPLVQAMFEELAAVRRALGLAKLSTVVPWVKNFLDGGEKLILFAYHSDVVKRLAEELQEYSPAVIWGGTQVNKRQAEVDRFQTDEACRVIIMNIDAGGVGYTLTRAADVAFAEGDWVPTKIQQAIDRACRIGQLAAKIMAFFLMANGSLDCRIAQSSKVKEDNICAVMDT